eukprot:Awhi_evm1s15617
MSLTFNGSAWGDEEVIKYDQLYSQYPSLEVFYPFQFEKDWNGFIYSDICSNTLDVAMYICATYFIGIFTGQWLMKQMGMKFKLQYPLALWNFSLSLFSFIGAFRVVPHLLNNIHTNGYEWSVCAKSSVNYGLGASGMWTTLFIFSKIPELFDTVFIVLRG